MPANTTKLDASVRQAATIMQPFSIKHPALQGYSDCLFHTCKVMVEAAKALDVNGNNALKDLKRKALTMAKKFAKDQAKCLEVPETEARSMLKVNLFKSWPILDRIASNLPVDTESKVQFRDMVVRAVEEIDECATRNSKSNTSILDNQAGE